MCALLCVQFSVVCLFLGSGSSEMVLHLSLVGSDTCILRQDKCNPSLFPE